jgi:ABC-type Fe3+/spermidine/putrescine transport system ATPase subunit
MVKLNEIRFSYADKEVIKGLSIEFKRDFFYCILGPSGQGKSTLLKIIAGYCRPSSGTLEGPDHCGFVLQGGGLFDHFKVK